MANGLDEIMADTYTEATSLALVEGPPFKAPGCIARGADRLPYMYIQIDIDIYTSIDIYIYIVLTFSLLTASILVARVLLFRRKAADGRRQQKGVMQ